MTRAHPANRLIDRLRALEVGESTTEPGKTARQVSAAITSAKRGGKWFTSQTLTTGARIRRYE